MCPWWKRHINQAVPLIGQKLSIKQSSRILPPDILTQDVIVNLVGQGIKMAKSNVSVYIGNLVVFVNTSGTQSLNVGNTVSYSAIALDINHNPVPGRAMAVQNSNPSVIRINSMIGDSTQLNISVTALIPGNAILTVTCDGIQGFINLTAVPVSGVVFIDEDWSSGTVLRMVNGFGFNQINANPDGISGVHMSTVNPYPGKANSVEFTFHANVTGYAWAELRYILGAKAQLGYDIKDLYARMYMYFPDGTEGFGSPAYVVRSISGQATNNKFFLAWAEGYGEGTYGVTPNTYSIAATTEVNHANAAGDGTFLLECGHMNGSTGVTQGVGGAGITNQWPRLIQAANRGRWIKVQLHFKTATNLVTPDGIMDLWLDDVLIDTCHTVPLYTDYPPAQAEIYFRHGYILGWSNSGFDEVTKVWLGPVKMADHYITD